MSHETRTATLTSQTGEKIAINVDQITCISLGKDGICANINMEDGFHFETKESYKQARIILDEFEIFPSVEYDESLNNE